MSSLILGSRPYDLTFRQVISDHLVLVANNVQLQIAGLSSVTHCRVLCSALMRGRPTLLEDQGRRGFLPPRSQRHASHQWEISQAVS